MLRQLNLFTAISIVFVGCLAAPAILATPASAAACDRACLAGMMSVYVDALVAHDPAKLPVTADVRFTEDSKDLKLGEGLWTADLKKGDFRQDYLDTDKGIAAAHLQFWQDKDQILYSVLLRVKDKKITGIETLVQRVTPDSRFQPKMLGKPLELMNVPVPADKRMAREAMIRTALTYTEGLRIGSFVEGKTPFAKDANRIENGVITSGVGCSREDCTMQTQKIMKHPDVKPSVAAVDEQNGVVLLWMNFGDTGSYGPGNALVTFEAFKVWGGEIHAVNAFFGFLPASTERNWPSSDPLPVK